MYMRLLLLFLYYKLFRLYNVINYIETIINILYNYGREEGNIYSVRKK
jgi:hypothetical protein